MLKSRSIRIAVNLCVTVALLMPGNVSGMVGSDSCAVDASKPASCSRCCHCSINEPGERCGCCCKKPAPRADEANCCKSRSSQQASKPSPPSYQGICTCAAEQRPGAPAPQGRSILEQLVQIRSMGCGDLITTPCDPKFSLIAEDRFSSPALLPRDSLRLLCIWRI